MPQASGLVPRSSREEPMALSLLMPSNMRIFVLLIGFAWIPLSLASQPTCTAGVSSLPAWPHCDVLREGTFELFWRLSGNPESGGSQSMGAEFRIIAKDSADWYA